MTTKQFLVLTCLMLGVSIFGRTQNAVKVGSNFQTISLISLEQVEVSNIQFPIENTTVTYELEIVNTTLQNQNITISVDDPLINYLVVSYYNPDNRWEVIGESGWSFESNNQSKTNLNFSCNTTLGVGDYPEKFRISVGDEHPPNNIELRISATKYFSQATSRRMYLLGMYFGLFLIIIIYMLFSYFSLKKAYFLWFSLFVFFIGIKVSITTGVLPYFVNILSTKLDFELSTVVSTLIFLSFIRFLQLLISVKNRFPKLNQVLIVVVVLRVLVNLLFISLSELELRSLIIYSRSGLLIALLIALYVSVNNRNSQVWYTAAIVSAFSFLILTGLLDSVLDVRMLNFNWFNVDVLLVGNLIQVLLFLVAISILVNNLANERMALGEKMREAKKLLIQAYITGVKTEKEHISKELEFLVLDDFTVLKTGIKDGDIKNVITKIEDSIRVISDELKYNPELMKPFFEEVEDLAKGHETKSLKITVREENLTLELHPFISKNLLRVIQECIQNVEKYADASIVKIEFEQEGDVLILSIKDDGIGFDSNIHSNGIGLKNMQTRVKEMKGEFKLITSVGKGVAIEIRIPIKDE